MWGKFVVSIAKAVIVEIEIKQEKLCRTQEHVIPNSNSPASRIMAKADSPRHIVMKLQNIDAKDQIFSFYKGIFLMDE